MAASETHSLCLLDSSAVELVLGHRAARCPVHVVASLADVRTCLESQSHAPRMLDLIGHSRRDNKLLVIGHDTVDMFQRRTVAFFEQLAADALLPRLGIRGVRLLGCQTAAEPAGQRTIRRLAATLAVPVYGTMKRLRNGHYCETGFDSTFDHILIESADLPAPPRRLA